MPPNLTLALIDALDDVRTRAQQIDQGLARIRHLLEAKRSEDLGMLEQLQELRMTAAGSVDGVPLQDRDTERQDDAA